MPRIEDQVRKLRGEADQAGSPAVLPSPLSLWMGGAQDTPVQDLFRERQAERQHKADFKEQARLALLHEPRLTLFEQMYFKHGPLTATELYCKADFCHGWSDISGNQTCACPPASWKRNWWIDPWAGCM